MRFAILGENQPELPPPIPETEPEPEPKPKPVPKEKITLNHIITTINKIGCKIAEAPDATIEEKIEGWIDLLKSILPHIPVEEDEFRKYIQHAIDNPSQWDFMEKPKRHVAKKGKAFHFSPRNKVV